MADSVRTLEEESLKGKIGEYRRLFDAERDTEKRKEIARKMDECTRRLKKRSGGR